MTGDVQPGHSFPLGASAGAGGVNFSVFSRSSARVELLLFDPHRWRRWLDTARPSPEDIRGWATAPGVLEPSYLVQPRAIVGLFARTV